jgi:hypothetical protein
MFNAIKRPRAPFAPRVNPTSAFPMGARTSRTSLLLVASLLSALSPASAAFAAGAKPVKLRSAGSFVILTETGITDVAASKVKGNIGASPITGAADLLTCAEVKGKILSIDAQGPQPCGLVSPTKLGKAVTDMQHAYKDAARRIPTVTELGAGNIGGLTLAPGVYSWSSGLLIPTNVTLHGSATDVWIFQVAQNVDIASATQILLSGGATPANIFWQVAGAVTIGTTAQFEGVVLSKTAISMATGASIHGRLYAQTAVSLEKNAVSEPRGIVIATR